MPSPGADPTPDAPAPVACVVLEHAAQRYCERLAPGRSMDEARAAIQGALQRPLFSRRQEGRDATLYGCRDPVTGKEFVAVVAPPRREGDLPFVATCGEWWAWHELKRAWREYRSSQRRPGEAR